jgi:hypothetical protein
MVALVFVVTFLVTFLVMFVATFVVTFVAKVTMILAMVGTIIPPLHAIPMMLTIVRDIGIPIPIISHEVDGLAARVIFAAMPAPMPFVPRPHVQVNRGWQCFARSPDGDHRRTVDEAGRRSVTEIEPAKEAGFTNVDGYPDVGAQCGVAERRPCNCHRPQ